MPSLKPSEVYVGVMELFSVFLPGALLAAALVATWGARPLPPGAASLLSSSGAQWVAFAMLSYALGHFMFMLSASIDYPLYDRYRNRRWPRRDDDAYRQATAIRHRFFRTDPTRGDAPMNTFAWCKAILLIQSPAACASVERFEADSKFFRSLIVVLPLFGLFMAIAGEWLALPVAFALSVLSFLRYAERRHKSTEWAYYYTLVLMGVRPGGLTPAGSA